MIRACLLMLEDSRFALLCLYTVSTASNIMVLRLVYTKISPARLSEIAVGRIIGVVYVIPNELYFVQHIYTCTNPTSKL